MRSIPHLYDGIGRRITNDDGTLIPTARTFQSVWNSFNKTFSYKRDEALRDSPENALAMRRDIKLRALLQERLLPTINRKWQFVVEEKDDPVSKAIAKRMTELTLRIPRFYRLKSYLAEAAWFGNYGAQVCWARTDIGHTIWHANPENAHAPVNGDKIQWGWDGTPVIMVEGTWAAGIKEKRPELVTTMDRWGSGYILSQPEDRRRFIIHTHTVEDADFFESEMAGVSRGLGLRSICYWSNWIRVEIFQWIMAFMESVGMMDLLLFNYDENSSGGKEKAESNAKLITGKLAMVVPRKAGNWPAVETINMNTAGITVLMDVVDGYFDRGLERMMVGQSMTGGEGSGDSLGGEGKSKLARDTKTEIVDWDTRNLDETFNNDLFQPMLRYNFPWYKKSCRFSSVNEDAQSAEKVETGVKLIGAGVSIKADELREAGGYSKPVDGDELAKPAQTPGLAAGAIGQDPNDPDGNGKQGDQQPDPDQDSQANGIQALLWGFGQPIFYRATYSPYTIKAGPRKGTSAYKNTVTGEIVDKLPQGAAETASQGGDGSRPAVGGAGAGSANGGPPAQNPAISQAQAAIAAMPLTPAEQSHMWNAVQGLAAGGNLVVTKSAQAAVAVRNLFDEFKNKILAYEITADDVLYTLEELSNPIKMMSLAGDPSGPVGGWYTWVNLLPKVTAYIACKLKAVLRPRPVQQPVQQYDLGTDDMRDAVYTEIITAMYSAIYESLGWPGAPSAEVISGLLKKKDSLTLYEAMHAPAGGVTIGGKHYVGGQFIPSDVVDNATAEEKKQLEGGGQPPKKPGKPKPEKLPVEKDHDELSRNPDLEWVNNFTSRKKALESGADFIAQRDAGAGIIWGAFKTKADPEPLVDLRSKDPKHPIAKALHQDKRVAEVIERYSKVVQESNEAADEWQTVADERVAAFDTFEKARATWADRFKPTAEEKERDRPLYDRLKKAREVADAKLGPLREQINRVKTALPEVIKPEKPTPPTCRAFKDPPSEPLKKMVDQANAFVGGILNWNTADGEVKAEYGVRQIGPKGRAHCEIDKPVAIITAAISKDGTPISGGEQIQVHEIGHMIETRKPGVLKLANEFLAYRTAGETPVKMKDLVPKANYGDEELGCPDDFAKGFGGDMNKAGYCGKGYDGHATEIVSMGLERLYENPVDFFKGDPEYFAFMVKVLGM